MAKNKRLWAARNRLAVGNTDTALPARILRFFGGLISFKSCATILPYTSAKLVIVGKLIFVAKTLMKPYHSNIKKTKSQRVPKMTAKLESKCY